LSPAQKTSGFPYLGETTNESVVGVKKESSRDFLMEPKIKNLIEVEKCAKGKNTRKEGMWEP